MPSHLIVPVSLNKFKGIRLYGLKELKAFKALKINSNLMAIEQINCLKGNYQIPAFN